MSEPIRLAVDAMSGDLGPRAAIGASVEFAQANPQVIIELVGDSAAITRHLQAASGSLPVNITVHHAGETIAMDADPRHALRYGRESSLWHSLARVQQGAAQACVSAANSGALVLMARRIIGVLENFKAPAFCKAMPVACGATLMLDLGATLKANTEQLIEFAYMGAAMAACAHNTKPRVALLNIGVEAGKGTAAVREAAKALTASTAFEYTGFIEADEIFNGAVDVIVCDGFSGNIALKASEGVARLVRRQIALQADGGWRRLLGLLARPLWRHWWRELNPDTYNGAVLAGLNSVVVKSHGGASVSAFKNAIQLAVEQVEAKVPTKIAQRLQSD